MAKYYSRRIRDARSPSYPSPTPLRGLQPALKRTLPYVFDGQDRVIGASRRIVAERSLVGQRYLYTTERDDTNNQVTDATSRISMRSRFSLTPGHLPMVSVLWIPAGRVSNASGTVGLYGSVEVVAAYGSGESATETLSFGGSSGGSGTSASQEPSGPGALARAITHSIAGPMYPGTYSSSAFVRAQCQHIDVEITVSEKAAARVIEVCVYEVPILYTLEADDDVALWYAHMANAFQPPYPWEKADASASDGDPRFGTHLAHDVMSNQRRGLGPCLVRWSAWDDFVNDSTPDDLTVTPFYRNRLIYSDAAPTATRENLQRYNLLNGVTGGYVEGGLGFQLSTGGYSRNFADSNDLVMHGKRATIPVHCHAYISLEGEDAPYDHSSVFIEFATSKYSSVRLVNPGSPSTDLDASGKEWLSSYGHLEVGINPEQPSVMQPIVSFVDSTPSTLAVTIHAIVIEKADNFATQLIPSWTP